MAQEAGQDRRVVWSGRHRRYSWSDRGVGTVARIGPTILCREQAGQQRGDLLPGQVVRAEPDGYTLLIGGAGRTL